MASVHLKNVVKRYGDFAVIHGISLDIADGEFCVFVGPSGCGKSTLLRMIAGLEGINDGEIAIGGLVVNQLPPVDRDIAMVFQDYALYPHMTVGQNLGFALRMKGVARVAVAEKVQRVASILQIEALLDRRPKALSGGQRQRVAMGRAMIREPKAFLFDEPLSNLDAKLRVEVRTEIKRLHQRLGATMIYVTHDQVEAMTLADRIVVLEGGHVQQIGTPAELYRRPASAFVAGFIGSPPMNLISCAARQNGSGMRVELEDGQVLQLFASAADIGDGRKAILGVRPEDIEINPSSQGAGTLRGTVDVVEPLGADTMIVVRLGSRSITVRARPDIAVAPQQIVELGISMKNWSLFDAETGKAIGHA
jgi:multiple sugar transport system ATP-binding protein